MLKKKSKPTLKKKLVKKNDTNSSTPSIKLKKKLNTSSKSQPFKCLFDGYTKKDYEAEDIKWIEPMLAKEPLNDNMLQSMLIDDSVIAEDKLDGTRSLLHMVGGKCRLFSRNISKKSGWFTENSDRCPHIRDIEFPESLGYTVLDGELKVPDKPFETVSSILNCTPEEAYERQKTQGKIVLNVFDILWYNGECVEDLPVVKRKELLKEVLEQINSEYLVHCQWFTKTIRVPYTDLLNSRYVGDNKDLYSTYPLLFEAIRTQISDRWAEMLTLNKSEYYEYVVIHGGEGIMLKDPNGKYYHKRGREYTKYKKFLTRDCIAISLTESTKEYTGKELKKWGYWVDENNNKLPYVTTKSEIDEYLNSGYTPVTKPYYYGWFGNLEFGVVVSDTDIEYLKKVNGKAFKDLNFTAVKSGNDRFEVLIVGECAGFDDNTKDHLTKHPEDIVGKCVEIRCNEIFKKTGKLRHPRFMRIRTDKNIESCIFKDHIQSDGEMNV